MSKIILLLIILTILSQHTFGKWTTSTLNISMVWKFYSDKIIDSADLSLLIPHNSSNQEVVAIYISEPFTIRNNKMHLHFENITSKKIYGNFIVKVNYLKISNTSTSEEMNDNIDYIKNTYLKSSKLIVLDSKIGSFSNNFSGYFPFKIISVLDWISLNIEYAKPYSDVNISDIIEETMPSNWVFENKKGVCDEFSNLFTAIMRSMGIPTRIVSGFALIGTSWIPHSWAEVYLEPYGWIEVDPTFHEFMNLDAARVRIGSGTDQSEIVDRINITSEEDVKLLKIESSSQIEVVEKSDVVNLSVEAIFPYQDQLSTIQPMIIKLKNSEKSPIYTTLSIIHPEGVTCNCTDNVFLLGGEEKSYTFLLNLPQLSPNIKYIFPLTASTDYGNNEFSFTRLKIEHTRNEKNINESINMRYFIGLFFIAMVGIIIIAILRRW